MAIEDQATVVGVTPRLSQARFVEILREHSSPAEQEDDAGAAWSTVKQQGVDPAFALAIFHQESQFGTDASSANNRFNLRNPGHTRSSRTGVGTPVDTGDFGQFIRYPSWTEGWRDLAFRLVDRHFDYVTRQPGAPHRTIRSILLLWAPPGDPHDPDHFNIHEIYVAHVMQNMTDWADLPDGGQPIPGFTGGGGGTELCPPLPPPTFDGTDKQVGNVVFHAAPQTVTVAGSGLRSRQFADPTSCETSEPFNEGDTFRALYWVKGVEVGGEGRWWVSENGSRIWSGGTQEKPNDG